MFTQRNGETGRTDEEAMKGKSRQQWVVREMQKTVLMDSETILRKIMSGVMQEK